MNARQKPDGSLQIDFPSAARWTAGLIATLLVAAIIALITYGFQLHENVLLLSERQRSLVEWKRITETSRYTDAQAAQALVNQRARDAAQDRRIERLEQAYDRRRSSP